MTDEEADAIILIEDLQEAILGAAETADVGLLDLLTSFCLRVIECDGYKMHVAIDFPNIFLTLRKWIRRTQTFQKCAPSFSTSTNSGSSTRNLAATGKHPPCLLPHVCCAHLTYPARIV